ncbi:MAG TPA: cytochrome c oxidase subunit 3 family protein [Thermodesulfovibrionales bacterium]|nr:cytochrome c oxidase subunit 3 family protein [Thermodesulfovibrionales bacterium]
MDEPKSAVTGHRVDYTGAKMGMWIFLFTEVLFFGGLFLLYSVFRTKYTAEFHSSAAELDLFLGTANTVFLLTSSMTMALSIAFIRKGKKGFSLLCQGTTIFLGITFLVNKYVEWTAHIHHGIYPDSPLLSAMSRGKIIFFSLYYVMTGLHGLHVLIGVCVISGTLIFTQREIIGRRDFIKLENTGLYWHFVDIVWIYLFPLFYLIT